MTMHKSKGKEFDGVVLVEGAHVSPFLNTNWEEPPYQESRRLLRVGITRARNHVVILRPNDALRWSVHMDDVPIDAATASRVPCSTASRPSCRMHLPPVTDATSNLTL